jgi:hypothetical protein
MTLSLGVLLVAYALVGLLLAFMALNLNALQQKVNEFSVQVKQRYRPDFLAELEKQAAAKAQEIDDAEAEAFAQKAAENNPNN